MHSRRRTIGKNQVSLRRSSVRCRASFAACHPNQLVGAIRHPASSRSRFRRRPQPPTTSAEKARRSPRSHDRKGNHHRQRSQGSETAQAASGRPGQAQSAAATQGIAKQMTPGAESADEQTTYGACNHVWGSTLSVTNASCAARLLRSKIRPTKGAHGHDIFD
jgi:hypothetical protein